MFPSLIPSPEKAFMLHCGASLICTACTINNKLKIYYISQTHTHTHTHTHTYT